eukprot:XP_786676.3 PREDICTED: cytochrome c oxidase subunit NDUFA4 [Strongylocentrotus purpuratus]
MMQGLTWSSLKHHKALIPLFIATGGGAEFAAFYLTRLVTKSPDASWRRSTNPHPWQNIKPDQNIKFYSAGKIDFKNLKKNSPDL